MEEGQHQKVLEAEVVLLQTHQAEVAAELRQRIAQEGGEVEVLRMQLHLGPVLEGEEAEATARSDLAEAVAEAPQEHLSQAEGEGIQGPLEGAGELLR